MKTFKEYGGDITNPYNQYRDGSSLLGPSMGQYHQLQISMQTDMTIPKTTTWADQTQNW